MKSTKFVPKFLKELPSGEYSLSELATIANRKKESVCRTLNNLGLSKEYTQCDTSANVREAIYFWPGIEDYSWHMLID